MQYCNFVKFFYSLGFLVNFVSVILELKIDLYILGLCILLMCFQLLEPMSVNVFELNLQRALGCDRSVFWQ